MNKDSFSVLIDDAYDGLEKTGEPVTMKAGHAAHDWIRRNIKSLRARKEPDVRYPRQYGGIRRKLAAGALGVERSWRKLHTSVDGLTKGLQGTANCVTRTTKKIDTIVGPWERSGSCSLRQPLHATLSQSV
jgi:hypothetical protein